MSESMRIKKLLIEIDNWFSSFCYYDDEADEVVIDGTEAELYNCVMQNDEFHLLGSAKVQEFVHIAFTDWDAFVALQHKYKAFA